MDELIFAFILYNVLAPFCMVPLILCYYEPNFFTPNYIYHNTKMNIIGCYISSLVIILLLPIYCVPASIIFFLYFLFHIGRK